MLCRLLVQHADFASELKLVKARVSGCRFRGGVETPQFASVPVQGKHH